MKGWIKYVWCQLWKKRRRLYVSKEVYDKLKELADIMGVIVDEYVETLVESFTISSFEDDVLPVWQYYSDYIGFQLWADKYPLTYGIDWEGNLTAFEAVYRAKFYADSWNKPVHINELPAWHQTRLDVIADLLCHAPNKVCIYKLWDYDNSTEYFYALYLFNHENLIVEPNPYSLNVFKEVFAPKPTPLTVSADEPLKLAKAMVPVILIFAMLGIMKRIID